MVEFKTNSEYEKILPSLSEEEFASLKTSIEKDGLLYPIIVNDESVILDGHNRYKICKELGIDPKHEVRTFDNPLEEKAFVITVNLKRRHLSDFQKAEMGTVLLEVYQKLAKQRHEAQRGESGRYEPLASIDARGKATGEVAKQIGISQATFERAKKIIEEGSERLKNQVRSDEKSIFGAYTEINIVEAFPEDKQNEVREKLEKGKAVIKDIKRVAQKSKSVEALLETATDEVREKVMDKVEDKMWTDELDYAEVERELAVQEGSQIKLMKAIVEVQPQFNVSFNEIAVDEYFKDKGGRFLRVVFEGEVDPYLEE